VLLAEIFILILLLLLLLLISHSLINSELIKNEQTHFDLILIFKLVNVYIIMLQIYTYYPAIGVRNREKAQRRASTICVSSRVPKRHQRNATVHRERRHIKITDLRFLPKAENLSV